MPNIIAYPGIQAWWQSRSHWFSKEFVEFVNELERTAGPPSLYREQVANGQTGQKSE
jgi:hypothetical protein